VGGCSFGSGRIPECVLGQTVVQTVPNSTDTQRCVHVIALTSSLTTLATPSKWPSTLVLSLLVVVVVVDDDNDDVSVIVLILLLVVAVVGRRYCPLRRGEALNFINPIHAKSVEMCRTESVYPCTEPNEI